MDIFLLNGLRTWDAHCELVQTLIVAFVSKCEGYTDHASEADLAYCCEVPGKRVNTGA